MNKSLLAIIIAGLTTFSYSSNYVVMVKEEALGEEGFVMPPVINLMDKTIIEPDITETVKLPINLYRTITNDGSVNFSLEHISTTNEDLELQSGTINFERNKNVGYANIILKGDTYVGENKTFKIKLSSPNFVKIDQKEAIITINDTDQYPKLSLNDIEVIETDSGIYTLSIPVKLANPSSEVATIDFSTNLLTASTHDLIKTSGSLIFSPNETEKTIYMDINGDLLDEIDETFELVFSNPINITLEDNKLKGTIIDNDNQPNITISDLSINEGNEGEKVASVEVNLSAYSGKEIKVDYNTLNETADENDYSDKAGTLTFSPGEISKTIPISIIGDYDYENNETFNVLLSNPINVSLNNPNATVTINNDDSLYQFNTLPLYGVVEYNDNVNGWQQVIAGTEYSNQYQFRYNPTESEVLTVSKDIKVGSFDTDPSTPSTIDGNHSLSEWGTVSGNTAVYKNNGVTVKTILSTGNIKQNPVAGIGSSSYSTAHPEIEFPMKFTITLAGDYLNDVTITAGQLGGCFDVGASCETKVVVKAYDLNNTLISTQGGYRDSGIVVDDYNFKGTTAISKFLVYPVPTNKGGNNSSLSSGNMTLVNMTISRSAFEEIDYELKNSAGESSSETLKLNINEGNANTNVDLNNLLLK